MTGKFHAYWVEQTEQGVTAGIRDLELSQLPADDVLIEVQWSSLNYKDALAARGDPGVARQLPHVPGIDAAGTVVESRAAEFAVGQPVIVTGHGLGGAHWGGWSRFIRVPADWVLPLPPGLSLYESMVYGTAGFTAAQCVMQLQRNQIGPDRGPVVVTGATGGVGCLAVAILAQLGYEVTASTGKPARTGWLRDLGAREVVSREQVRSSSRRPLLSARWAGAVDTVGGETLGTLLRETVPFGCVTACGLVGGATLDTTVHPFILRGVVLAGVSASLYPPEHRLDLWRRLAGDWRVPGLDRLAQDVNLDDVDPQVDRILAGAVCGRIVVRTH